MKVFVSHTGNYPDSSRAVPDRLELILFNAVFKVFGGHYLDTKVSTANALNTQPTQYNSLYVPENVSVITGTGLLSIKSSKCKNAVVLLSQYFDTIDRYEIR